MQGIELKARREALGMSQADLARVMEVSQSTVSSWEVGSRNPRDPEDVDQRLWELEQGMMGLLDSITQAVESKSAKLHQSTVELRSFSDDKSFWDAEPSLEGMPAAVHRAACAHAAVLAREEYDIRAVIVER